MSESTNPKAGVSRRDALKAGAMGCTGAAISTSMTAIASASNNKTNTLEQWQPLIGQNVKLLGKSFVDEDFSKPIELQLVEVARLETKPQPGASLPEHIPRYSLSLCFEGSMRTNLPSATYRVMVPKIGGRDLFLNELQPNPDARRFEAILN